MIKNFLFALLALVITSTAMAQNVVSGPAGTISSSTVAPSANSGDALPYTVNYDITGLAASTTYWIDLAGNTVAGGTCTIENNSVTAHEIWP